eukprot:CAMPEP_0206257732 /NCGR_PEP_ID=MMETSP0047_2-20121206/25513_1 /ASSEMBLY_ACC=CAM_ASM_000192 /TAXON_ID=195065 /ORGANISM="Chroomonas mesostigmatica_cf, Strain CCMP1168" /LENGTH=314 /DNA_ID=CAMNT_0053684369 /DNA_START=48 /DNA_END=989 /DNA_ORIENTATION=+
MASGSASQAAAALLKEGSMMIAKEVDGKIATTVGVVGFAAWWLLSRESYFGKRNYKEKIEWAKLARKAQVPSGNGSSSDLGSGSGMLEDEDGFMHVEGDDKGSAVLSVQSTDGEWDDCRTPPSDKEAEDLKAQVAAALQHSKAARAARKEKYAVGGEGEGEEVERKLPDGVSRAVLAGDCEAVIKALDDDEAAVDACDEYGNTLLILAAQAGSAATVDALLQRGADINAQNWRGQTALHFCLAFSYNELGDFLLARGADREIRNDYGLKPEEGLGGSKGGGMVPLSPGGVRIAHPGHAYMPGLTYEGGSPQEGG